MRWLIYGHRGWLASYLLKEIQKIGEIEIILAKNRADDESMVEKEILTEKPDRVISFIGRTSGTLDDGTMINSIDYLEYSGKLKENINDNLFAPMVLALICKKYNIHLSYLGTGCIFNSDIPESTCYSPEDKPDFFGSSYSVVKGYTDRLMHLFDNVLNLRIRMPITGDNSKKDFIQKILNYSQICSMSNSMTVIPDIFPIIVKLIKKREVGTWNMVNPGVISHNEILGMYREIVDEKFTWNNFSIDEQDKLLMSKRSNNRLNTDKLEDNYAVMNIKDSIREIFIKMREKRDNKGGKNIFVITSVINLRSDSAGKSVYTSDERFKQTLKTISSIREKTCNSVCILVELSKLTDEQKKIILDKIDIFVDLSNDETAQKLVLSNKSMGDIYTTIAGLKKVKATSNDLIYKISGRYYLDDYFNLSIFSKDTVVFREIRHDLPHYKTICFETKLFGFGSQFMKTMIELLEISSGLIKDRKISDIEHAMYGLFKNVNYCKAVDRIGISGNIAPTGEFVSV